MFTLSTKARTDTARTRSVPDPKTLDASAPRRAPSASRPATGGGPGALGASVAPPMVRDAVGAPGQPLDAATRAFMEPRFGRDFSRVRVHSGTVAERSAEAVAARAYTLGSNVVFARGEYSPGTDAGRRLLAHELAHVVQQGDGASSTVQRQPAPAGAAPAASGGAPAAAAAAPAASTCPPIGAQAQAACSAAQPNVTDATTGKPVVYSVWAAQCVPTVSDAQLAVVKRIEDMRIAALDSALRRIQRVQAAILLGDKRAPRDPSWKDYATFFLALGYMNVFWSDSTHTLNFDYFGNAEDKQRYDRLGRLAEVLSRNLSFLEPDDHYLCSALRPGVGAVGTGDGIILEPAWFGSGYSDGYRLLTLTHEYFHVMVNPLIDDYPAFRAGRICTFDEALGQPNTLAAFVAYAYTGQDEQVRARGFLPCTPGQT